jgi:histone H3/H4
MMSAAVETPQSASDSGASEENDSNPLIVASDSSVPELSSTPSTKNPSGEQTAITSTTATSTALPSAAEFEPPLACIRRILKNALPSSTNVGKDASAAFARASGIFIIYLTACANDFARENKRQTITANDVLAAIKVC